MWFLIYSLSARELCPFARELFFFSVNMRLCSLFSCITAVLSQECLQDSLLLYFFLPLPSYLSFQRPCISTLNDLLLFLLSTLVRLISALTRCAVSIFCNFCISLTYAKCMQHRDINNPSLYRSLAHPVKIGHSEK